MKTRFIFSVGLVFLLVFSAIATQAQNKTRQANAAKKVEATRGSSTYEAPSEDAAKPKPANSRGSSCCLEFSNNTGYWVDIWVDGEYAGRLGPWESDDVCVGSGFTKWYAQTAGKTYYWSNSGNCSGGVAVDLN